MNKKYYTFLLLIFLLLFLIYNIVSHKYKEYKISEHIGIISLLNAEIKESISKAHDIIEYKKSKAYQNKILKQSKGLKNKWEIVVYITSEDKYNKYINKKEEEKYIEKTDEKINEETFNMTIYQKRMWFLFKEDLR